MLALVVVLAVTAGWCLLIGWPPWRWFTHGSCAMCGRLDAPRRGNRRVCIYCPRCAPEFYE